jgi:hypothetical protein
VSDDRDDRPWERPGAVRRDCEPHRGQTLEVLGTVSLACGALSLFMGLPALLGLPLGAAVLWLSSCDLTMMEAGRMNPAGKAPTLQGQFTADLGVRFSAAGAILWGVLMALT